MSDDHAAEWEDLDEKVILVQILTELQQIRTMLSQAESGASDDADTSESYECRKCGAVVTTDARERHARETHKAPADMIGLMFTRVE